MIRIKGSHLQAMRQFSDKTTDDMAKIAGVKTRKTYENWEKDVGSPNINQFIALATFCQLDVPQLMGFLFANHGHKQFGLADMMRLHKPTNRIQEH